MKTAREPRSRTLSDTRRVEAFSDGVFAIAITLLVLDLHVPHVEHGRLLHGLIHQWGAYIAYVTSFIYVGVLWLNHHNAFNRIERIDRGLQWANLGVLFAAAILPFPTAVVSSALQSGGGADRRTAVVFYALVSWAMSLAWLAFFQQLATKPELVGGPEVAALFKKERRRAWTGAAAYGSAVVVGFVVPIAALVIFLALPIFYAVTSEGAR